MPRCSRPCAGCGAKDKYRDASRVCSDCEKLMARGREAIEQAKHAAAEVESERAFKFADAACRQPYIAHGGTHADTSPVRVFQELFLRLATAVGREVRFDEVPSNPGEWVGHRWVESEPHPKAPVDVYAEMAKKHRPHSEYGNRTHLVMPEEVGRLFSSLYRVVADLAESAYDQGYARGQQLLVGLASGELSVQKFNEATRQEANRDR